MYPRPFHTHLVVVKVEIAQCTDDLPRYEEGVGKGIGIFAKIHIEASLSELNAIYVRAKRKGGSKSLSDLRYEEDYSLFLHFLSHSST